jgi:putative sigma-54 modulation protein
MQMNITIIGDNIEVTPAMREYAMAKLERVKKVYGDAVHLICSFSIDASIKAKQYKHRVSINLRTGGSNKPLTSTETIRLKKKKGVEIFVQQLHENMYAALDLLVDRLVRQINRYKGKALNRERSVKTSAKPRYDDAFARYRYVSS